MKKENKEKRCVCTKEGKCNGMTPHMCKNCKMLWISEEAPLCHTPEKKTCGTYVASHHGKDMYCSNYVPCKVHGENLCETHFVGKPSIGGKPFTIHRGTCQECKSQEQKEIMLTDLEFEYRKLLKFYKFTGQFVKALETALEYEVKLFELKKK